MTAAAAPRPIGRSGLSTLPLALGGNVFGWTADKAASFAVLDRFVDGGGTIIDTADLYSNWVPGHAGGESETIIGEWLKASGKRNRVLIATKVGMSGDTRSGRLDPAHVAESCDGSLRRLGVDRIDLYYAHRDDIDRAVEEPLQAFDALVRAGKVRAIAASNFQPDRLTAALNASELNGWARYEAMQPLYNLLERDIEDALVPLCIERGVAILPFFSLAAGYLTGKYRRPADVQGARARNVGRYVEGRGPAMLDAMDAVAAETGATLPQLALAWLAAKPGVTAPIASATSVAQLDELLAATRLTLTADQIARLDAAGA